MNVTLIANTEYATGLCCDAAAVCTKAKNGYGALISAMESGHESVLEHAVFTFRVEGLSRAALAQLTRHRLASFSVQSQRYVKLDDRTNKFALNAVIPESIRKSGLLTEAAECIQNVMKLYQDMVEEGIPAEDARYITPQAVTTDLIVTMNARELRHFFSLRTCAQAQWEIREMADKMLKICKSESPIIFSDCGPGCLRGACPEKRPCGKPRDKHEWDTN